MRGEFIVCYDICEPKRLRKVFQVMREFGVWMQYSVFWCQLSPMERAELEGRLLDILDRASDQVLFIRLGPAGRDRRTPSNSFTLGRPLIPKTSRSLVL